MDQEVRFCTTEDGVRVAYAVMGSGRPLVWVPGWLSHLELDVEFPPFRERCERLAENFKLVRFDKRGTGLSQRGIELFSLEAHVLDLEAVVAALGLEEFALAGYSEGGPISIAYAVQHPESVSHLVLMGAHAEPSKLFDGRKIQDAILTIAQHEWGLGSKIMAERFFGLEASPTTVQMFSEYQRQAATGEDAVASAASIVDGALDVSELLAKVSVPTLVLHARGDRVAPFELGQQLAAGVRGARFISVDGNHVPDRKQMVQMDEAIREFVLGSPRPRAESRSTPLPSGTAVILFADIVDSTALTERLGDAAFRKKARDLDTVLRAIIRERAGTPIEGKLLGDGVLAVFTSARQAIEAALACGSAGDDGGLPLHLGLHAGDVIREDNNVYGGAVNIASRISGLSAPGEVLVSATVRDLARTSAGVAFDDRGEQSLKGIDDPVRVWAVKTSEGPLQ